MPDLRALSTIDVAAVERLLDAAFGIERKSRTAYAVRTGTESIPELSFGLIEDEELLGSLQCWPIRIRPKKGEEMPLVMVGPVAVHPDYQRQGFGHLLMQQMLTTALEIGNPPMLMIGDVEYYGRFGFSADNTGGWELPGPVERSRLLLRNPAEYPLPAQGMIGPDIQN